MSKQAKLGVIYISNGSCVFRIILFIKRQLHLFPKILQFITTCFVNARASGTALLLSTESKHELAKLAMCANNRGIKCIHFKPIAINARCRRITLCQEDTTGLLIIKCSLLLFIFLFYHNNWLKTAITDHENNYKHNYIYLLYLIFLYCYVK